jgi:hypothetical protein
VNGYLLTVGLVLGEEDSPELQGRRLI